MNDVLPLRRNLRRRDAIGRALALWPRGLGFESQPAAITKRTQRRYLKVDVHIYDNFACDIFACDIFASKIFASKIIALVSVYTFATRCDVMQMSLRRSDNNCVWLEETEMRETSLNNLNN